MRPRVVFALLFAAVLAARMCHLGILWVEESYPAAAAIQILHGKTLYRDFWFDKPPVSALAYLAWGARAGWPLRLAGALFVTFVCFLLWRFARSLWGEREAGLAAVLGAVYLTFGIPSAVLPLAPDLLMLAPHVAAVCLAWRGRTFWSGLLAGVATLVHTKGVFVLGACMLWQYRALPQLLLGFAAPNAVAFSWMAASGALRPCFEQVWEWGLVYSRDTFVAQPVAEGLRRTLNWSGFHAVLLAGAGWYWLRGRDPDRIRFALWALLSLASVAAGWRFFPRYYLHLLPVAILAGARGLALLGGRRAALVLLLLAVPLVRFGPRYALLARDLVTARPHGWSDLAMYEGSRETARFIAGQARPHDTLFVWGYRPDIFAETRLAAGAPFLDSQPLTGVIADRHLTSARASAPELASRNRLALAAARPTFVVDGLGPYNPRLALTEFRDLAGWLAGYRELWRSPSAVVYRVREAEPAAAR